MRSVNNHKMMLIAKDANTVATAGVNFAAAVEAGTSGFGAGQVAVVDASGVVRTAASSVMTAYDEIYIVQSQGAGYPIIKSGAIPRPAVSGATVKFYPKAYSAAVAQVDYIGYNASSNTGSLIFVADQAILVRASLKSNFAQFQDKELHVLADHTPTSASTEATVAAALTKSLVQNSEKFVNVPFTVERVSSATGAANTSASGDLTATKGSKTVTGTGATVATDYAVGDYLRWGTGDTAAVYKLTAVTDNVSTCTLTLDIAFQGTSATLTATNAGIVTAAQAAAGTFGIKLTGKSRRFQEGKWRYETNKWITTVAGMGATLVANVTVASEGNGTYSQIAEDEWAYQVLGEDIHNSNLIQVGPVAMRKNVTAGGTYHTCDILVSAPLVGATDILNNPVSHKAIKVAWNKLTSVVGGTEFEATIAEFLGITNDGIIV